MKHAFLFPVSALLAAAALTACSAPAPAAGGPPPVSPAASGVAAPEGSPDTPAAPEGTLGEELPVKAIPGCRADLPYPLKMSGESLATDFSHWAAKDLDGNVVTEEVLKGSRLTLVSVWSTFCDSCMADMAALQEVYDGYDRAEVNVVGIAASAQAEDGSISAGELEIIRQLQEAAGAKFLQLLPSDDLIAIKLKDLGTVPESFLLDSGGNLVGESVCGGRTAEEFRRMVEDGFGLLGEGAE